MLATPVLAWEPPPAKPFAGVEWTLGMIGLLVYLFVIHQGVAPLGEAGIGAALVGVFIYKDRVRFPVEIGLFLLYMLAGLLSTIGAKFPQAARDNLVEYLKLGAILWLACNVVRTKQQLRAFVLVWLLFFAVYPMRGVLFNYVFNLTVSGRVAWNFIFANPNDLAAYCLVPITMCAGLLVSERRGFVWFGALLQLLVLVAIVFITQSRGGIIALMVTLILLLVRQRPKPKTLMLMALGIAVVGISAPKTVWNRLSGLTAVGSDDGMSAVDAEGSAAQRVAIWKVAKAIINDYPVFGVGIGTYSLAHRIYARNADLPAIARGGRDTHSTYINATAETGLFGVGTLLALFLYALWKAGKQVEKIKRWSPPVAMQLSFIRFGFIGLMVSGLWGSYQRTAFLYLYIALMYLFGEIHGKLADQALAAGVGGTAPAGPIRVRPTGRHRMSAA